MTVRRRVAAALVLALVASGCLATAVESPARPHRGPAHATLRVHLLAAPRLIDATECRSGLSDVTTYEPLWGLAAGFFSLGIVVPQWTVYTCAAE